MKRAEPKILALRGNAGQPQSVPAGADVSVSDWDLMFEAVITRLRTAVGEAPHGLSPPTGAGIASPTAAAVLDCAQALETLHAALARERRLHRRS